MKCTGVHLRNGFKLIKTILTRQYSCLKIYQFQHLDSFDLTIYCLFCCYVVSSISSPFRWLFQADQMADEKTRPQRCTLFSWLVCAIFNIPQFMNVEGCETGPAIYSPYSRRLESLTICGCYYKGSTFSSIILRPWVLRVRPESNSRSPA